MKEEKEDFTLDVRELSNEELVSILGAETTVIGKCPKCGGTNITATVSLPPLCVCMEL